MYTHICIADVKLNSHNHPVKVKKGDFVTLLRADPVKGIVSGIGYIFKEDAEFAYSANLFLPLPPQQEKTVYVAVTEEVTKQILEPQLN